MDCSGCRVVRNSKDDLETEKSPHPPKATKKGAIKDKNGNKSNTKPKPKPKDDYHWIPVVQLD